VISALVQPTISTLQSIFPVTFTWNSLTWVAVEYRTGVNFGCPSQAGKPIVPPPVETIPALEEALAKFLLYLRHVLFSALFYYDEASGPNMAASFPTEQATDFLSSSPRRHPCLLEERDKVGKIGTAQGPLLRKGGY
jgi:hypothetical protein